MLTQALAILLGGVLALFALTPSKKDPHHFDFMDAILLFTGLGAFLYGVLSLTPILPR